MWCHWCRKANHNDAQCFSTRPADWVPKPEDSEPTPRNYELARVLATASKRDLFEYLTRRRGQMIAPRVVFTPGPIRSLD